MGQRLQVIWMTQTARMAFAARAARAAATALLVLAALALPGDRCTATTDSSAADCPATGGSSDASRETDHANAPVEDTFGEIHWFRP